MLTQKEHPAELIVKGLTGCMIEVGKCILTPINRDENKEKMNLEEVVKNVNKLLQKRGFETLELQLSNGHMILRDSTESE